MMSLAQDDNVLTLDQVWIRYKMTEVCYHRAEILDHHGDKFIWFGFAWKGVQFLEVKIFNKLLFSIGRYLDQSLQKARNKTLKTRIRVFRKRVLKDE